MRAIALAILLTGILVREGITRLQGKESNESDMIMAVIGFISLAAFFVCVIVGW